MAFHSEIVGDGREIPPSVKVLEIKGNTDIESVLNLKDLIVLQLYDTKVSSITGCNKLNAITLDTNHVLKELIMPSIRDATIRDATNLTNLVLTNVIKLTLSRLPNIQMVLADNLRELSLSDIHLWDTACFKNLQTLNLRKVEGVALIDFRECQALKKISISHCACRSIKNINNVDSIIIDNCPRLQEIDNFSKIGYCRINRSRKLIRLTRMEDIDKLRILCCDAFSSIKLLNVKDLKIEHCFGMILAEVNGAERLSFEKCMDLFEIILYSGLRYLSIDDCRMLEMLRFKVGVNVSPIFMGLTISIKRDINIAHIKDWYASKLIIENNSSIETIDNIYNLGTAIIKNCKSLCSIGNLSVNNILAVHNCPELEKIENICCVQQLAMSECDSLTKIGLYCSEPTMIKISQCMNLQLAIDGCKLDRLTLYDCGLVIVDKLASKCSINTNNASILPDLMNDNEPALTTFYSKVARTARLIQRVMRMAAVRSKYKKYKRLRETNDMYLCVICHEDIDFPSAIFTSCDHMFHNSCFKRWMLIKRVCPLCNTNMRNIA